MQYYRQGNTSIIEGNLVIEARRENFGGRAYTSSRMVTKDKFDFKYGRVDIRAALPFGQGIWPALWMLGTNFSSVGWPACGEIDILAHDRIADISQMADLAACGDFGFLDFHEVSYPDLFADLGLRA